MSAPAGGTGELPEVERSVARQAARWMMLLGSVRASPSDLLACEQWRSSKAEHEHAWQRAQRVSQRFGLVPATLGMAALNRPASPRRRAVLKTLALTSATGPLAWAAWRADPLDWTADYRSAAGELREVALSDGSRLYLNTASAVDVAFSAASRLLRLRAGEIALHVRDESGAQARPFVVRTRYGDIEARATATACDRKTGFAASACRRALRVAARAGRYLPLAAGAELRLDDQGPSDAAPADPHAADWMRNVLHAREMRLDAFAAELGRYRPGLLRCDPTRGAFARFGRVPAARHRRGAGGAAGHAAGERALPHVLLGHDRAAHRGGLNRRCYKK
ncbi:FecR domain-containing protein [Achromobacter xylosoxidans]